ncbi:MAG: NADH-quinone oxidoreductase subunit N [Dehalococcoidia bacterium]|nr:NADH-quinone oxidoreductase subunit N [Dehalococcoidia bacterium]
MNGLSDNIELLTPEFALAGLAFLVFAVDLFLPEGRKGILAWLSIAGLIGLIVLSLIMLWDEQESLYNGLLAVDDFALFFKVFFMGMGVFIILSSMDYVEKNLTSRGEFYGLILFSILGMNVMAQSRELLTAYISLELLSFCLYVLAAYARNEAKSNEAGLKYIIIGAFSSALLLYGISMVYSTLGVTQFDSISAALTNAGDVSPALWVGMSLILVGLGFKLAAVPFHMWAPDVYEGAPFPVTAYLAIASKAAAFALVLRLFAEGFLPAADQWQIVVAVLASITMLGGNLVALAQHNIKRLMAYSSIGQVGIILTGIAALSADSILPASGVMLYLVGYSLTNMLVFAGLISFFNMTGKDEIADFRGLADGQPFLAATIAIGLFSLGGLPIFAGFTIKFYLFTALASQGMLWLAGLAIFSSLISLYYYLQVIRQMYIRPVEEVAEAIAGGEVHVPEGTDASTSPLILAVQAVTLMGVFWVGVYPAPFLMVIDAASHAILPGL